MLSSNDRSILKRISAACCAAVICCGVMAACTENPERDASSAGSQAETTTTAAPEESAPEETTTTTAEEEEPVESEASSKTESQADESQAEKPDTTDEETSDITPAMWKITAENGTTITLMGSMHALSEDDYPLPAQITSALDEADVLAVECDVEATSTIAFQAELLKKMQCDEGKTFSDYVSGEAYDGVSQYLKTYNLDISAFEQYKPWAVSNTLDSLPLLYSDLKADLGIDSYLIQQAKDAGKEIHEVESVDFQMDMIIDMPVEVYDLSFRYLVDESKDSMVDDLKELHDAWRSGDVEKIEELSYEDDAEMSEEDAEIAEEYMKIMLTDRNKGMEEDIKELMEGDKDVFFVVGAAHYVGEGGILDLLDKDGIEYEELSFD